MATGFTDFSEYEVGSPPGDFTVVQYIGSFPDLLSNNVVERAGSLSGQAMALVSDDTGGNSGNARVTVSWGDPDPFDDGEVVALLDLGSWLATANLGCGAAARMDNSVDPTLVDAVVRVSADDFLGQYHDNNDSATQIWDDNHGTVAQDDRWWIRLNFEGTTVKGRAWKAGDEEPETWNAEVTDAGIPTGSGAPGFICQTQRNSSQTMHLEALGWSDDPAVSAPTSAPSNGGGGGGHPRPLTAQFLKDAVDELLQAWT